VVETRPRRPLNVLFFLRTLNLDRLYEPLLTELLERGHAITIVVERERTLGRGAGAVVARLRDGHPSFSVVPLPPLADHDRGVRNQVRAAIDYLRYLEPLYAHADQLRARARRSAPKSVTSLERRLSGSTTLRRRIGAALAAVERSIPVAPAARAFVAGHDPDLVLVAPLVGIGSSQADWVRIAAELGVPSVLPVASWDNLTNKGTIKLPPTSTIVWNDAQAAEARQLHGLPPESVSVVGAHPFDPWFERSPTTTADEFRARVGLPADRPFLLYVASSKFIAADETQFVREWIGRIRAAGSPLRDVGILVRPHPLNSKPGDDWSGGAENVAVWPEVGELPTGDEERAGYFDSLSHAAAVVGINTSALIEAAIARRPSLTLAGDRFSGTQDGTLHFTHIAGEGSLLVVARSWERHLDDLADVLADPHRHQARIDRFLRGFVRPHGLDVSAAPIAVDVLERVAAGPLDPVALARGPFAVGVSGAVRGVSVGRRAAHAVRSRVGA
jgi:hypothetical protein